MSMTAYDTLVLSLSLSLAALTERILTTPCRRQRVPRIGWRVFARRHPSAQHRSRARARACAV